MAAVIGIELEPTVLVLTKGRDFKWSFKNLNESGDPVSYPDGELYFEFPELDIQWDFVIVGATASLKVESVDVDLVPNRAKWQLVFLADGEEAGGDPVARGQVLVQV